MIMKSSANEKYYCNSEELPFFRDIILLVQYVLCDLTCLSQNVSAESIMYCLTSADTVNFAAPVLVSWVDQQQ